MSRRRPFDQSSDHSLLLLPRTAHCTSPHPPRGQKLERKHPSLLGNLQQLSPTGVVRSQPFYLKSFALLSPWREVGTVEPIVVCAVKRVRLATYGCDTAKCEVVVSATGDCGPVLDNDRLHHRAVGAKTPRRCWASGAPVEPGGWLLCLSAMSNLHVHKLFSSVCWLDVCGWVGGRGIGVGLPVVILGYGDHKLCMI